MEDHEITNRVLLQHMQGMRTAIESRLERLEIDMKEVKGRLGSVEERLKRVETDTTFLRGCFTHLQERFFSWKEYVAKEIPAIKKHVGMAA